ncbi:MAG: hypothetical protein Q4A27_02945 [bacterium]|nr:hypothetical protein [bacterium]
MEKEEKKPKKRLSKKQWALRISVALLAVLVAVGAFFGVKYLIEKAQREADIKVGDTTISYERVKDIQSQAQKYKEENPDVVMNDEIAKDALLLNAGLKEYATKKCGLDRLYNKEELADFSGVDPSELEEGSFEYISKENLLYKNKLKDCLIQRREIFRVSISYETPYMQAGSKEEQSEKHNQAKKRLSDTFLPLFEQGASKEEIAKLADMNLLEDEYAESFDFGRFQREAIVNARMMVLDQVEGSSADNFGGGTEVGVDLSNAKPFSQAVANLKKGEYTKEVVTTVTGSFTIARIESTNDAEFLNWDDFLTKIKEQNNITAFAGVNDEAYAAKTLNGQVCYAVSGDSFTCQATGGSMISKPGFYMHDSYPLGDFRHLKAIRFRMTDGNGYYINGVKVDSNAPYVTTRDTSSAVNWRGMHYAPWGSTVNMALEAMVLLSVWVIAMLAVC